MLGMADAGYLTIAHYRGLKMPGCSAEGCERVLTSWWAHPHWKLGDWTTPSIPTSLYGFCFYAAVFLLLGWNVRPGCLLVLSTLAFLIHLGFVYVQARIIYAWCPYCLVSAGLTTLVWLLSIALWRNHRPPE